MHKLKIIRLMNELIGKYNDYFPINNSLEMMKILNLVMEYHLKNTSLSLKILYTELKISDLCARSNLKRMESNGWLSIEKLENDSRVRVLKPTEKLINSYEDFYNKIINDKKSINDFFNIK